MSKLCKPFEKWTTYEGEEFVEIPGFEGRYLVSDAGRVGSLLSDKILKPRASKEGYHGYGLWRADGRQVNLDAHQLVMLAFVGPRPEGMEVRHLNGNASDNRRINLAYGTPSENTYDRVTHGTHSQARKTECPNRHAYDSTNTQRTGGRRVCRTCKNARNRAYMARKRAEKVTS